MDIKRAKLVAESKFEKFSNEFCTLLKQELGGEKKTTLYDHQIKAVLKTKEYFDSSQTDGLPPALIVAPTGSGKSGMVALLPYVLNSKKVLVLTPSKCISTQLGVAFGRPTKNDKQKITNERSFVFQTKMWNSLTTLDPILETVNEIESTRNFHDIQQSNLAIVNAQKFGGKSKITLTSGEDIETGNVKETLQQFSTLIVDEAHHYPAKTWKAIVELFSNKQVVFLTATPQRNGIDILENQQVTYKIPKEALEGKFIRKHNFKENKDVGYQYSQVREDIREILKNHDDQDKTVKHKAMILAPYKTDAKEIAEFLGYDAIHIVSSLGKDKVADNLRQFKIGEKRILVVCGMFREGFDHSPISLCIILRKVRSTTLFAQFVGRCLRISKIGDPVEACILSYVKYEQKRMWIQFDKITDEDPEDEIGVDILEDLVESKNEDTPIAESTSQISRRRTQKKRCVSTPNK